MTKLRDLKKRFMEDPEFREEYARADDEFALIEALIRARGGEADAGGQLNRPE
ncbi:MAG: hypothetical protein OXF89_05135 [Rhodospirillaceae bacterium]|nr:hypothetical protein [Rhodospirillaceae bacterium]MCY4066505.1 hypothetical protein [Rhodospirillaceae bacterium]